VAIERNTFEACARHAADRFRIGCRRLERDMAGQGVKVGVPEFDADRLGEVALVYEIFAHPLTEFQQDLGKAFPVVSWMQVALEGRRPLQPILSLTDDQTL
jgi:hypothetical protein